MVLELDIQVQKDKVGPLHYTIHKKMNSKSGPKT